MIFESSSFSNAIFLSAITIMGIALYAVFAYLVAHSKNIDTRRRWRYSILWGVSFGVIFSIFFSSIFVLGLFVDIYQSGFMTLVKQSKSILDLFTTIIFLFTPSILINLPVVFIGTFGTYTKELSSSDLNVTRLLYPVQKHPSDQSPDDISTKARKLIVSFVDG